MGTTTEVIGKLLEGACRLREQAAAGKTYFSGAVIFYRGLDQVATIIPKNHHRDQLLHFARVGASGFGADLVALVMDAYSTNYPENPHTGQPWGPGEMQELVKHHQGRERGWVHDIIAVSAANRAGDIWMVERPYTEKFRRVTWAEPRVLSTLDDDGSDGKVSAEGVVTTALRQLMTNTPSLDQIVARAGLSPKQFGIDPEEERDHLDCATVKAMDAMPFLEGAISLSAEPGSRRAEIIRDSLGPFLLNEE